VVHNVTEVRDQALALRYLGVLIPMSHAAMSWKENFIEDYAGHPLRVALNVFLVGATGILIGHFLLGMNLAPRLVFGAMLPALGAIVIAGRMKLER
jgi:hypothetical protein